MIYSGGTHPRCAMLAGVLGHVQVQWGDVGTWAAAAATFLAVLVALFVALLPSLQQKRQKPVLVLVFGEVEPFERPVFRSDENNQDKLWEVRLRVGVKNEGHSTARNVQVRIDQWWSYMKGQIVARTPGEQVPTWTENPIDPVDAEWVGWSHPDDPHLALDITPGSTDFVDLLVLNVETQELRLPISVRRGFKFPFTGGPYGEQRLALSITSDNAEGTRQVLSVTITAGAPRVDATKTVLQSPIHDVRLTEPPDESTVMRRGLMGGLWTSK
jgi:hypothetical protein